MPDDDDYVVIENDDDDYFDEKLEDLQIKSGKKSAASNFLNDGTIPDQPSTTGTISFALGLVLSFIEFVIFFIVGALKRGAPIDIKLIIKGELVPLALLMIPLTLHGIALALAFWGFVKKDGRRGIILGAMALNLVAMGGVVMIAALSLIMK
ncbi:hypothetical protein N9B94_04400 [Verrucomicrobia bacterium]|nr:hypothetical protein [Verrucomicrobiota bacterium]